MRALALSTAACLAATSITAHGQSTPAPPQSCAQVLTAPTRDSVVLRVMLAVQAFDRDRDLPSSIQFDFGQAVRRHLVLPQPLVVEAYESAGDLSTRRTAHLTLRGDYAATLTAEGHIVDAETTGGVRSLEFDTALLAAMRAIDSTDHLAPTDAGLPKRDIRIRVAIAARDTSAKLTEPLLDRVIVTSISGLFRSVDELPKPGTPPPFVQLPLDSTMMPLFSFRVPVREVTSPLRQIPGLGAMRYPDAQRRRGAPGQVQLSFVVDTDGQVESESVQVVDASHRDFAKSVLDALPNFRYRPLEVSLCRVRAFGEAPIQFFMAK